MREVRRPEKRKGGEALVFSSWPSDLYLIASGRRDPGDSQFDYL